MIIPLPTNNEPAPTEIQPNTPEHYTHVREYLDCEPWKCHVCGSTVFGRCQSCAYCRHVKGVETKRP